MLLLNDIRLTLCQCNDLNYDSDMRHLAVLLGVIMLTLLTDNDGSSNAVRKKPQNQIKNAAHALNLQK